MINHNLDTFAEALSLEDRAILDDDMNRLARLILGPNGCRERLTRGDHGPAPHPTPQAFSVVLRVEAVDALFIHFKAQPNGQSKPDVANVHGSLAALKLLRREYQQRPHCVTSHPPGLKNQPKCGIITFLSILEMAKQQEINIKQDYSFDKIYLELKGSE